MRCWDEPTADCLFPIKLTTKSPTSDIVTMAAEKVFREVINFIVESKLNHSIYLTPFSAQLSVKKSFSKHYVERNKEHTLAMKLDHIEENSQKSDLEILKLQKIIQEKEETNVHLQIKSTDV